MDLIDTRSVKQLLTGAKDILLGISGGIDSMALLTWMAKNRASLGVDFRVVHVDHRIAENSESWARFVSKTCYDLGVKCDVIRVDLDGLGNNLEYAARQARYKAFCSTGADTIVLAHHANDQCESFLLKLFRGSGVRGLKAMESKSSCWYDDKISVVRPMLNMTRSQIEAWADMNGVVYIEDPSNKDNKYDRNYIRNEIWPVIQDRFDIADINTIRSIDHLSEAWQLTKILAEQDLNSVTMTDGGLEWVKVKDLGYLRIKNMILRILDRDGVYGFSVNHVEQFAHGLIDADMDSRNELRLKGFTMNKIGKRIHINDSQRCAA